MIISVFFIAINWYFFRFDEQAESMLPSSFPLPASSKGKSPKATVVNEDAVKKISALEEELSHLRAQIAAIVSVHGARNYQSRKSPSIDLL